MIFDFLRSNKDLPSNLSGLGVDMHSHILPGIDDGSPDVETSLALLSGLHQLGYSHFICTPHIMADLYPNTPQSIQTALAKVQQAVEQAGLPITIQAAAEYLMDEQFESILEADEIMALPGKRVLVEMSFVAPPPNLFGFLFKLQTKGYTPVIAHPERYLFFKKDMSQFERFKEHGCELQLNILSLIGYYGSPAADTARALLKKGWVNYLGTDLHHERHLETLRDAVAGKELRKILATHSFQNSLFIEEYAN